MSFTPYIALFRPHQWLKNGFVLAPVIFAGKLFDPGSVTLEGLAFILFCLASSGVYAFNDVFDREEDRNHPTKRKRPVAAGEISPAAASTAGGMLILVALLGALAIGRSFTLSLLFYIFLQVAYNLALKKVVLLDILTIAMGFVIRAVAGSYAIAVATSPWLILCSLLIALFLGCAKRRREIVLMGPEAVLHRFSLRGYSVPLLDQLISIVTAATIVSYAIYTLTPEVTHRLGSRYMILTLPFVLYGIFRYLYLVHLHDKGESPTRDLLADLPLLAAIAFWAGTSVVLIYLV